MEHNQRMSLAWHIAALSGQNSKLPPLDRLLAPDPDARRLERPAPRTRDERRALHRHMLKAFSEHYGLPFVETTSARPS
jgi:hypothetical protein